MLKAQPAHRIHHDPTTGILHVAHGRFDSDAQFDLYYGELELALAQLRASGQPPLLLINNTEIEAVCSDATSRIARLGNLFVPEDRIALIVRSNTLKMQFRGVAHDPSVQSFVSENAARTWLLAYNRPAASAA